MTQTVLCPLDQTPMQLWLKVAGDRRRPSEKASYQLYWCEKCQYGMLHPRPAQHQDCLKFYDVEDGTFYTHQNSNAKFKTLNQDNFFDKLRLHLAWRLDRGVPISGTRINQLIDGKGTICDIGCGNGYLLLECQQFGHSVRGIEPDPKARSVAQSRGLEVEKGTAEDLPKQLSKESFDVVIMSHVLEHCLAPILALANVKSLLKPGGFLVCEVPNNECISAKLTRAAWSHLGVPRHLNFFTKTSLVACIQQTGLDIVSTSFNGYCRQFSKPTIELERRAYDFFDSRNGHNSLGMRPSAGAAWLMLMISALSPAPKKYDSVSVVAQLRAQKTPIANS